jgi:hypothetical protein
MYQLYALSIIANLGAGISVAYVLLNERLSLGSFFSESGFTSPRFRLIWGLFTLLIAVFKLFVVAGGGLPVLGDFIPAITGLVLGFILIFYFYLDRATIKSDFVQKLESIFIDNAGVFGILGIVFSLIHLVFPGVLFL